ncbi:DUF4405 domain-containing protein [Robertmurraya sp. P23]|uniref:DUF4405 domain-containing protein n=1 Tax=Robertmurraya sp. P23 TaxID=3436931 RepID=UPI003D986B59
MKEKKLMYVKFGLDILMAVTFVLFFNKQVLGGLTFHEIAGLAIAAVFFTHIALNWRWVKNVTVKLLDRKLPFKTKFGYVLNLLLLITMAFIIISGILVSHIVFPNINVANERWFQMAHISISYLVLVLVAAHVGLHWKWVIQVFNKIVKFKTPKPVLGIVAKVATAALLVFGSYEIYSTNFLTGLLGVYRVFATSSSEMPEGGFVKGQFERGTPPSGDFSGGSSQFERSTPPDGAVGQFARGGFEGRGDMGSTNALEVILQYFSIMSVFIILIYYLEKLLAKRKKKPTEQKMTIVS